MNFFSSLNIPPINAAEGLNRVENSPFQRLNLQNNGENEEKVDDLDNLVNESPDSFDPLSDDEPVFDDGEEVE